MPKLSDLMSRPGRGPSLNELNDPAFVCAERAAWQGFKIVGGDAAGPGFPRPQAPCREGCVCYLPPEQAAARHQRRASVAPPQVVIPLRRGCDCGEALGEIRDRLTAIEAVLAGLQETKA